MERSPSSFPAGVNLAYTQQKCAKLWQKYAKNFLEKGHNPHPRPHLQWRGYPLPISVFLGTSVLRTSIYRPTPTILLDTPMGCNHPVRHWLLVTSHLQEISQDLFIICPIAIAYHGIDYKITCVISVYVCMCVCMCVCMYVCVCLSVLSRSQFWTNFDEIWHRRPKPETKEPFRWGSKSINGIRYFYPILPQIGTHVMHFQWETWNASLTSSMDRL